MAPLKAALASLLAIVLIIGLMFLVAWWERKRDG